MAKYYQHLNSNDDNFQSVTTLEMIDNSDPSFVLYYFKDGTKCNKDFIGGLNEKNVYGRLEMVEVSSPANIWKFKKVNLQSEVKYATNAQGEKVEIPDMYTYEEVPTNRPKVKIEAIAEPIYATLAEPDSDYYMIGSTKAIQQQNTLQQSIQQPNVQQTLIQQFEQPAPIQNSFEQPTENNKAVIDAEYMLSTNKIVEFVYNGHTYNMPANDFFANAIKYPEEKIIEKVVEKVVEKEQSASTEHLEINVDDNQKALIDNMIDMSNKESFDLDIELALTIPPVQLYKLIKTSYPNGMADAFINIIADRMNPVGLKTAVANGLALYYEQDDLAEKNDKNENVTTEKQTTKRRASAKK